MGGGMMDTSHHCGGRFHGAALSHYYEQACVLRSHPQPAMVWWHGSFFVYPANPTPVFSVRGAGQQLRCCLRLEFCGGLCRFALPSPIAALSCPRQCPTNVNARMALVYYMDFLHCHGCVHLSLCSTAGGPFPLVLVVLAASTAGRAELYVCDVICMSTAARMGLSICWMLQCLPGMREAVLLVVLCVMSGVLQNHCFDAVTLLTGMYINNLHQVRCWKIELPRQD